MIEQPHERVHLSQATGRAMADLSQLIAALAGAGAAALMVDSEGMRIVDATPAAASLLQRRVEQMRGLGLGDVLWECEPAAFVDGASRAALLRPDGRIVWVGVSPLSRAGPTVVSLLSDISDLVFGSAVAAAVSAARLAALTEQTAASFARSCLQGLVEAGLCHSAAFLQISPEAGAWQVLALIGSPQDAAAARPECGLLTARDIPVGTSDLSHVWVTQAPARAALAELLDSGDGQVAMLAVRRGDRLAGVVVGKPFHPLVSAQAYVQALGTALAEGLEAVLRRARVAASVGAAEADRRSAARSAEAIESLSLLASALLAAEGFDEAVAAVLEALKAAVRAEWVAVVARQRPTAAFVVRAAAGSATPPASVGGVIPRHDPAVATAASDLGSATGDARTESGSFQRSLVESGVPCWASARLVTCSPEQAALLVARRADVGGVFDEGEMRVVRAAAAMLSLVGIDYGDGDVAQAVARSRRFADWLVRAERLQMAMDVARGVTHHLGNKLAVLVARLEMAAARAPDDRSREAIEQALQAADAAGECLRQLQIIAWRPAEEAVATFSVIDALSRAIKLTEEQKRRWLGARAEDYNIGLEVIEEPVIIGNLARLTDAFVALLQNAIDSMPRGGRVKVRVETCGPWARVLIADEGLGIPHHLADRVFAPFFSTKGPTTAGLGLTVASSVIAKHGGMLLLCSALRRGTTVGVYLPRADGEAGDWQPDAE